MWYLAAVDVEQSIKSSSVKTVLLGSLILAVATVLALLLVNRFKISRLPLFVLMAGTTVLATLILFGNTIYLNVTSESKGPVHWHTGIEFWSCGAEINLRDPQGFLSNKIGTPTLHEHNDKFIHLEGVVVKKSYDASLGKFMEVTGGYVRDDAIGIPLTPERDKWFTTAEADQIDGDGQRPENFSSAISAGNWVKNSPEGPVLELKNGNYCSNDDEQPAELQVFLIRFNKGEDTYTQQKLEHPADYVMRDESILGPPSDCLIVEYDTPRDRTDKLCQQYGIKDAERCVEFGVKTYTPKLCTIRDITAPVQEPMPLDEAIEEADPADETENLGVME